MGLDQYAYVAARAGQQQEYYEVEYSDDPSKKGTVAKPREIAYWRKHPNLHGWMERLYRATGGEESFNGVELELTWEDLDQLEQEIKSGAVGDLETTGFFFGEKSDVFYKAHDLEFIKNARAELFLGLKVFYNSSW